MNITTFVNIYIFIKIVKNSLEEDLPTIILNSVKNF